MNAYVTRVMGGTGTGKTTVSDLIQRMDNQNLTNMSQFINAASGKNFKIGDGPESCTTDIQHCTFTLSGRDVTLIDTPGFDDTDLSETEVLRRIIAHLETA